MIHYDYTIATATAAPFRMIQSWDGVGKWRFGGIDQVWYV